MNLPRLLFGVSSKWTKLFFLVDSGVFCFNLLFVFVANHYLPRGQL